MLSSILHRDQARLYAKRVDGGVGELELSPEEHEAVRLALDGDGPAAAPARRGPRLMRVAYLGPEGTNSHEALLAAAGAPERARARSRCRRSTTA